MSKILCDLPLLQKIIKQFPSQIKFCFAYGSGILKQKNNVGNKMLDLVFVVRNSNKWHAENLARNWKHYANPIKFCGPKVITNVQDKFGAKIYYNTLVNIGDEVVKYGVMSEISLVEDLLDWNDLYMSGRLHKPVKVLIEPSEQSHLRTALVQNLHSAVHAALLLLPEYFSEKQFYRTIAGLSYTGDFRMTFGENKDKVDNIVTPQLDNFRELYAPILKHFDEYLDIPNVNQMGIMCHQDISPGAKIYHLNQLPRVPQIKLVRAWSQGPRSKDTEDCLRAIAYDPECSEILEQCLKEIVWQSSVTQSIKGIITAGFCKSIIYSASKIKKMLQSKSDKDTIMIPASNKEKIDRFVQNITKKQAENKQAEKRI